jgi:hypothetical protein
MVGARGFEPPTPDTPCQCATRLRYAPINDNGKMGEWNTGILGVTKKDHFLYRSKTVIPSFHYPLISIFNFILKVHADLLIQIPI